MADGGYRSAWNVQLATDVDGVRIVGDSSQPPKGAVRRVISW
jgi:hypothetical protein